MSEFGEARALVGGFLEAFDRADDDDLERVLKEHTTDDYHWRGMHPFGELVGAGPVVDTYWRPLRRSLRPMQRRPDLLIAGRNDCDGGETLWVCQMGHLMGLFDEPLLGIRPTGRMTFHRFAEFHRVEGGRIAESAHFCDLLSIMQQAGQYPLAAQTGAAFVHPGPLTHDGVVGEEQDPAETRRTMTLINEMAADLDRANRHSNETGEHDVDRSVMERSWHEDMIWYGPAGIGATYTIDRYRTQHQLPFRRGLTEKQFNGHIARIAEGRYGAFFGWANLTNRSAGGFLGLTEAATAADMRVVDVYRRDGDRLAENWVFIDLLHWLDQKGMDVLARLAETHGGPP